MMIFGCMEMRGGLAICFWLNLYAKHKYTTVALMLIKIISIHIIHIIYIIYKCISKHDHWYFERITFEQNASLRVLRSTLFCTFLREI